MSVEIQDLALLNKGKATGGDVYLENLKDTIIDPSNLTDGLPLIFDSNNSKWRGADDRGIVTNPHNTASGSYAMAEGFSTCATSDSSHAEGFHNNPEDYFVEGEFITGSSSTIYSMEDINGRIRNNECDILHSIGNGSTAVRENAQAIDALGSVFLSGSPFLRRGIVEGELIATSKHNYALEPGAMYVLFCWSNLISTGAWRGMNTYIISCNHGFGTSTSAQRGGVYSFGAQGTVGVVLTYDNRTVSYQSTNPFTGDAQTRYKYGLGIGSCTTDCRVRYSLIKVIGSYEDFSMNQIGGWHSKYPEREGMFKTEVFDATGTASETHDISWFDGLTPAVSLYYDYTNIKKTKPWGTPASNYAVRIAQFIECSEDAPITTTFNKNGTTDVHLYLDNGGGLIEIPYAATILLDFKKGINKIVITYFNATATTAAPYLAKDLYRSGILEFDRRLCSVYPERP